MDIWETGRKLEEQMKKHEAEVSNKNDQVQTTLLLQVLRDILKLLNFAGT